MSTITHLLWQCSSRSIMKVCQAFSLLSASSAVGIRAKQRVMTSRASQHTCSSSASGSLPALVCGISHITGVNIESDSYQSITHWVSSNIGKNQNLLIDLADLLIRTEDMLNRAAARSPDYLLNCSNDTDIWDILGGLEEVLGTGIGRQTKTTEP